MGPYTRFALNPACQNSVQWHGEYISSRSGSDAEKQSPQVYLSTLEKKKVLLFTILFIEKVSMSHSENDDIWAESDDEGQITYERNLAEREWERLQDDHGNVK